MGFHENLHYMNEMLHGQMKSCRYLKFFLEENNACGKRYTFYSYTFSILNSHGIKMDTVKSQQ